MKRIFTIIALVAISMFAMAQTNYINNCEPEEPGTSGMENGYAYVDLGLPSGLKWATCNVGATTPEEYGDYFAWGEVEPKEYYEWSTYKYYKDSKDPYAHSSLTKYCNRSDFGRNGFADTKTVLDLEDDAAHVNWGGSWRMPTKVEQEELRKNCKWTWTTQNGVEGYKVVGPNGNSIFLPAAGHMSKGSLERAGLTGYYWSSSLETNFPSKAHNVRENDWDSYSRKYGLSVRPVCQ